MTARLPIVISDMRRSSGEVVWLARPAHRAHGYYSSLPGSDYCVMSANRSVVRSPIMSLGIAGA